MAELTPSEESMKKKLSLLIIFALCLALVIGILGACNKKNPEVEYKDRSGVIFYLDGIQYYQLNLGGVANYFKELAADAAIEPEWPENPQKEGYESSF